jgi:hypothetical protein
METSIRDQVLQRDGFACRICGRSSSKGIDLQLAHILPLCQGGDTGPGNLLTICTECNAQQEFRDYLWNSIQKSFDYYRYFTINIEQIEDLVAIPPANHDLESTFMNMLFVAAITSLETYLSDVLIGTINGNKELIRKVVETATEFRDRKFELRDIYDQFAKIADMTRNYLLDLTYHNLGKIRHLYRTVLQIEFPEDISDLARAIQRRHDIVHRGGKTKEHKWHYVTSKDVLEIVGHVKTLVLHIDLQLRRKPWAISN